eukprot:CAMPEP_0183347564 /NCGR_PEP_ID=MMETSP0164_2-20130417/12358_1 /TAXON_ID=221442 /ORGANISM="Coccolithus pelagicus ssp braarudi, Strain PLY182g" /LENGTH=34 /DNA_ID= /DNA_START= /DNA_END= /DNA_ORIENTATION=
MRVYSDGAHLVDLGLQPLHVLLVLGLELGDLQVL